MAAIDEYGETTPAPEALGMMPAATRDLPLKGFRVLNLGRLFNGPYAGFMLAMAGAEVIKVEPPQGDQMRKRARDGDYPFRAVNGWKKGISLNLKTARGRELLLEMATQVDVVLENYAPAFLPGVGLPPEAFLEANPRLVYASGSGYGRTGPYRDIVALDLTVQAVGGMMSTTGEMDGRPLKAGAPIIDIISGTHLYAGIVTALVERERTGLGRIVESSMMESMFASLLPAGGHVYKSKHPPRRTGNRHVADSYVPFDTFEASDGWIAIVCATDDHWLKLTHAMQRPDLEADAELQTLLGRVRRIEELTAAINGWASQKSRAELMQILQAHSVPVGPVREVQEILDDPHLHERGFLTYTLTETGRVALPNSAVRYHSSDLRPLTPPARSGRTQPRCPGRILRHFPGPLRSPAPRQGRNRERGLSIRHARASSPSMKLWVGLRSPPSRGKSRYRPHGSCGTPQQHRPETFRHEPAQIAKRIAVIGRLAYCIAAMKVGICARTRTR